jgi:quercetin dioxygenase-like cupin family protein
MIVKAGLEGYHLVLDGVWLKNLSHGEKTHLIEVKFNKGAKIPIHKHPHEQTGYLISGKLKFLSDDIEAVAQPGDSWTFPGETVHGAEALEASIVIEVFSPAREDYLKL